MTFTPCAARSLCTSHCHPRLAAGAQGRLYNGRGVAPLSFLVEQVPADLGTAACAQPLPAPGHTGSIKQCQEGRQCVAWAMMATRKTHHFLLISLLLAAASSGNLRRAHAMVCNRPFVMQRRSELCKGVMRTYTLAQSVPPANSTSPPVQSSCFASDVISEFRALARAYQSARRDTM